MKFIPAVRRHWASLLTVLISSILILLVLEIWRARRGVPMTGYASDGMLNLALAKGVLEHGWFQENPSVAAPDGQRLYDFAVFSGDTLHFAFIKVLGLVSDDPSFVTNLYFLMSFPLVALAAVVVFRRVGLSEGTSVACSILFSFLPYHLAHGLNGHLFLAAYFSVPFAVALAIWVLADDPLFTRGDHAGARAYLTKRSLGTALSCAVIAMAGLYYAVYTLILLACAGLLASAAHRRLRPLASAGGALALIVIALAVNFTPNLLFRAQHGVNPIVGHRVPAESEAFATKLTHLLLPVPDHRVDGMARLTAEYEAAPLPAPAHFGVSLGTFGSVGFLVLICVLLTEGMRRGASSWRRRRLYESSIVATLTFLFITVGGVSSIFAFTVSPQIRGWYRLSVFIGFAALLAVGLLLDALRDAIPRRSMLRFAFPVLLVAVMSLGVLDQAPSSVVPDYRGVEANFRSDRDFVNTIEDGLPVGSAVFQLPYIPFPEGVAGSISAYEGALGFLHSERLRWSWGAMRARPEDWQSELADDDVAFVARAAAAAGFLGLMVDRRGYADAGRDVEARLSRVLGREPLVSANRTLSFFDLSPLAARIRARLTGDELAQVRRAVLEPIQIAWGTGFSPPQAGSRGQVRWITGPAALLLNNPHGETRRVVISTQVTPSTARTTLLVSRPDAGNERFVITRPRTPLRVGISVPPGRTSVLFQDATSRSNRLMFENPVAVDAGAAVLTG